VTQAEAILKHVRDAATGTTNYSLWWHLAIPEPSIRRVTKQLERQGAIRNRSIGVECLWVPVVDAVANEVQA
jgi:DNA-binding IclR family transcriptional regulator